MSTDTTLPHTLMLPTITHDEASKLFMKYCQREYDQANKNTDATSIRYSEFESVRVQTFLDVMERVIARKSFGFDDVLQESNPYRDRLPINALRVLWATWQDHMMNHRKVTRIDGLDGYIYVYN